MELEHSFTVPIGIDRAWEVFNDVERIVPCMPGATLEEVDGDDFSGSVKVKVGPMQVTYQGTASFVERDEEQRRAIIEAKGDQQRGAGTAHATISAQLTEDGGDTTVVVTTDLQVTGRPAQFGRGVMADVGDQLLGQFADCLADELARDDSDTGDAEAGDGKAGDGDAGDGAVGEGGASAERVEAGGPGAGTSASRPSPSEPRRPRRPQDDEAIDLLAVAGPSVMKRVAPLLIGLVLLYVLWRLFRGDDE